MTYTFQCKKCGRTEDVVCRYAELVNITPIWCFGPTKSGACACTGKMVRVFKPPQIIKDKFKKPVHMTSVKDANNPRGYPIANSRSEMRRALEASNAAYGTKLVPYEP